jgi:hypothetical protein
VEGATAFMLCALALHFDSVAPKEFNEIDGAFKVFDFNAHD